MSVNSSVRALLAVVCLSIASYAQATTFDFSTVASLGAGVGYNPTAYSSGGLSVTVSGLNAGVLGQFSGQGSGSGGNGLGVIGGGNDLVDATDQLKFDFSPNAEALLSSVIFESFTPTANATLPAHFNVYADGVLKVSNQLVGGINGTNLFTVNFAAGITGSVFTFEGVDGTFRLQKLSVDSLSSGTNSVAAVPEPATFGLLAIGLAGLAGRKLRRR
jgi:hypothetical protein